MRASSLIDKSKQQSQHFLSGYIGYSTQRPLILLALRGDKHRCFVFYFGTLYLTTVNSSNLQNSCENRHPPHIMLPSRMAHCPRIFGCSRNILFLYGSRRKDECHVLPIIRRNKSKTFLCSRKFINSYTSQSLIGKLWDFKSQSVPAVLR